MPSPSGPSTRAGSGGERHRPRRGRGRPCGRHGALWPRGAEQRGDLRARPAVPGRDDRPVRGRAGKGLPWLVAEIDGVFAGYAYASPFRPRPAYRYGVEGSIYVEETARRHGVGRLLLTTLIERVQAMGLRHIIGAISGSATSEASIRLHRSLGFREVGTYRQVGWKFDSWLDVTLMQRDLDPTGAPPSTPGLDL